MLGTLRRIVPFDAAWLALADPMSCGYSSLASSDLDDGTVEYLSGPRMAHDIEATQTNHLRPPLSPSDLPYPAAELATWSECLIPVGVHEALAVALFTPEQRHVGFLAVLFGSREPPSAAVRRRVHRLSTVLALGVDPVRSLAVAAQLVSAASAGAVLCRGGAPRPLPGLRGDPLLDEGSPVVAVAHACLGRGQVFASFLWPRGGRHAPDGHARVTIVASPESASAGLLGAIVLAPARHLRGLTPRELEVLGLVIDGRSNQQIAHALVVTPRTVATHVEHMLVKLEASTRTIAAVRAEREGLYVPPSPFGEWDSAPPDP
jgi:DNA-binding CsgD family transcriptional regulator